MAPKRTSTSIAPAMTQAAIKKLVADSTEGAVGLIRWFERTESVFSRSNYTEDYKVKFDTVLCPTMVPNSEKLMEVFIGGLPKSIERNVTASKPQTLEEAITITQRLMDQMRPASYRTLHCQVSDLQQGGSSQCQVSDLQQGSLSDQELQKNNGQPKKQTTTVYNKTCNALMERMGIWQIHMLPKAKTGHRGILTYKRLDAFVRFRISNLETALEDIQVRHQFTLEGIF
ncbi:hypothetical protein Tco_0093633 [Tanacetum coccineum]